MQLKKLVFLITFAQLIVSCSILYKNRKPEKIKIEIKANTSVNYTTPIPYKIIAYYSNEKTWNITNQNNLNLIVKGGKSSKRHITPTTYPKDFSDSILNIYCTYTIKNLLLKDSLLLPYNYNGNIKLDFSGTDGADGKIGAKGSLNFLTRDGSHGENGQNGLNGQNGHDLTLYIWKKDSLFHIRINDQITEAVYFYKANENRNNLLTLNTSGGKGGAGGKGGKGRNGKNAEIKNDKEKEAGIGGNGGNGGDGGNGGNSGKISVYIHNSAIGYEKRIKIYNNEGLGGNSGLGGPGGNSGEELNAEFLKAKGKTGVSGRKGVSGTENNHINMEVSLFDISSVEPK